MQNYEYILKLNICIFRWIIINKVTRNQVLLYTALIFTQDKFGHFRKLGEQKPIECYLSRIV